MGIPHVSRIAASEDGVAHAARDDDVGRQTHNLVAAAKDVTNAIVAAKTIRIATRLVFRVVDLDMMFARGLVAAIVVAAKHSEGRAALDGNGSAVGVISGIGDEGVLRASKDGVDLDDVGVHCNVRLGDGRHGKGVIDTCRVFPYHLAHRVRPGHGFHGSIW